MRAILFRVLLILLCIAVLFNVARYILSSGDLSTISVRSIFEQLYRFEFSVGDFYNAFHQLLVGLETNLYGITQISVTISSANNPLTRIVNVVKAIYNMIDAFSASAIHIMYFVWLFAVAVAKLVGAIMSFITYIIGYDYLGW